MLTLVATPDALMTWPDRALWMTPPFGRSWRAGLWTLLATSTAAVTALSPSDAVVTGLAVSDALVTGLGLADEGDIT